MTGSNKPENAKITPAVAAGLYAVTAGLWIVLSGKILNYMVSESVAAAHLELAKGLLFVAVTALGVYLLLRQRRADAEPDSAHAVTSLRPLLIMLAILVVVVPPAVGFGILRFYGPQLEQKLQEELAAIATLKAGQIELWRREKINAMTTLAGSESLAAQAAQVTADTAVAQSSRRYIEGRLADMLSGFDYRSALLLNRNGQVLLSVGETTTLPATSAALLQRSAATGKTVDSTLTLTGDGDSHHDVVAPLLQKTNGRPSRFLLLRSDPERFLLSLMPAWPGHHASGETQLLRPSDHSVITFSRPPSSGGEQGGLTLAGTGKLSHSIDLRQQRSGSLRGEDHRGQEVLASYQALAGSDQVLVAKVSKAEALRPLRLLTAWVGGLLLCAQILSGAVLLLLWYQQRRAHQLSLLASSNQYEKALRQQQAVYFEMFEANPHPMWVFDRHSLRFLAVNTAAVAQYGYAREQFLAMRISDIRPTEEQLRLQQHLATQPREGIDHAGLWQHQRRDGSLVTVEISGHPLQFQGHDAEMVLAFDVTEREEMATQLRESERFAFATIDALALNIAVLDDTYRIVATNAAWRAFSQANGGQPSSTGLGCNYAEVCRRAAENGEAQGQLLLEKLAALRNREIDGFEFEYPCHSPDEQRWFIVQGKRFPGDGPLRMVVTHEAITERKLAELELSHLNRYYAALSNMNAAIMRGGDAEQILHKVCEIAVSHGELELVWAGKVAADGHRISPLASAGPATGYLDKLVVSADPNHAHGQGPVGKALRLARAVVVNDFLHDSSTTLWHEAARHWKLQAALVCPIKRRNGTWGVIAFYSQQSGYFSHALIHLLEELTADLAYGLDMREVEQIKAESEARSLLNAQVIESSHEGIYICDHNFNITMANRALCQITGYSANELIGKVPQQLFTRREDSDLASHMLSLLRSNGRWDGEIWQRRKNGEYFPAWLSATRVLSQLDGETHYVVIYRDITEQKEYQRRLEHSASHDPLTDLPNREQMDAKIDFSIAQAHHSGRKLAVLFVDLDRFKIINDSLGHAIGDELLKAVAGRILRVLPHSDMACRVGSDEFMLLLEELASPEQAARFADTLVRHLARPYHLKGHELLITASVGIAVYEGDGENSASLTRRADTAMASAKQLGRNRYQFYSEEMDADQQQQLELEKALRGAVARNELFLVYQPQCRLADGQLIGAEALVRWQHPELGLVPPDRFIPLAEASGLIVEMGAWILLQACQQARQWQQDGVAALPISVNVSALQFRQEGFVSTVRQALQRSDLAADKLELEITESLLMVGVDQVLLKLNELRALGVNLAIDDFGTGYSSLGYLRQFQAHRLKIDQSFIRKLPADKDSAAIAKAIVSLGRSLGMQTIAEGIETEAQLNFLHAIDCPEGQGYYFAKPLSPEQFRQWLAAR